MGIIVNNYRKENKEKVYQIVDALKEIGRKDFSVFDFTEIKEHPPPDDYVILSGSSATLTKEEHFALYQHELEFIRKAHIPLLGICFGHQLIGKAFNASVQRFDDPIKGIENIEVLEANELFSSWGRKEILSVPESHYDVITLPEDFIHLARSASCEIEAMKHPKRPIYGIQSHVERATANHPAGAQILQNFFDQVVASS